MDDDLRQAFATLSAQMSDIGGDARTAASMSRETAHEVVKMSRRLDGLEVDVSQLKTVVFGSTPPPVAVPPVVKRITHSEGELSELAGQVIAVKADLATVKEINEGQTRRLDDLGGKVDAIHSAVVGVITNTKVRFVGKVLFAAAVAYSGLHGLKVLP
jgi:hypothetical protein